MRRRSSQHSRDDVRIGQIDILGLHSTLDLKGTAPMRQRKRSQR